MTAPKMKYLSEKVWALAQWEIHNRRYLAQETMAVLRACAQPVPGPADQFGASHTFGPPAGIQVAIEEVEKLVVQFNQRLHKGLEMTPDEIHQRINEDRVSWGNIV